MCLFGQHDQNVLLLFGYGKYMIVWKSTGKDTVTGSNGLLVLGLKVSLSGRGGGTFRKVPDELGRLL